MKRALFCLALLLAGTVGTIPGIDYCKLKPGLCFPPHGGGPAPR